jgi:hypothetical protein
MARKQLGPAPAANSKDAATTEYVDARGLLKQDAGKYVGINAQTGTSYGPVVADVGKLVTLTNASAITVTMPSDATEAIPVNSTIDFAVLGAGMVTFAPGSGATVNGTPSLITRAQYSVVMLVKIAANTWLAVGDLA